MKDKLKILLAITAIFLIFSFINSENISYSASDECSSINNLVPASDYDTYACKGGVKIDVAPSLDSSSTIIHSSKNRMVKRVDHQGNISLYTTSFDVTAVGTDNSVLGYDKDSNEWINIYYHNSKIFDGEFESTNFRSQSYTTTLRPTLGRTGQNYRIDQIVNGGEISHSINIFVYDRHDEVLEPSYGHYNNFELEFENEVTYALKNSSANILIDIDKEIFGLQDPISLYVNGKNVGMDNNDLRFNRSVFTDTYQLSISSSRFNDMLKINRVDGQNSNAFKFTLKDYLDREFEVEFQIVFIREDVSISTSTQRDTEAVTSKRFEILATPGHLREVDEEYLLYFWSKNHKIPESPIDFFKRHENAPIKGYYNNEGSLTLRNMEGNYRLFLYAQDEESYYIKATDPFSITYPEDMGINISSNDLIFTTIVVAIAIIPVFIYISVKKKSYSSSEF